MPGSNSAINSPTKGQTTPVGGATIPEGSGKVPTSYLTHGSHRATGSPTRSEKRRPSPTRVPKSSGKVPTSYPTISTTGSPKTSIKPTTGTTSHQKPKSVISQASDTSTKTPKSSPPPATTTVTSTTTRISTGTSLVISASKTLTVSNGQTASAQVGWMVVGVGAGGSVVVGGNILPVAGGTEVIIEQNSSGQDELSTIESDISTTPTSTSSSTKTSKSSSSSSSSTSSSMASPTPYNIYPKFDSTPSQQSAFARNLEQIAQRGSVRSITGGRNRLLLWVASLTPAQASELTRNPVVRGLNVDRSLQVDLEIVSTSGPPPSPKCAPENCSHQKRDGSILMQQDALDDLRIFSQGAGASLSELPGYAYDARGGRGITVYVIDTGINPNHPEFRNMYGNIRWLYLPGEPHIEGDENGHGTCVTSKIVGPTFGVAKSANIVIVKMAPIAGLLHVSRAIAAWGAVAGDVASENLQGRAVVINAMGVRPNMLTENDRTTYIQGIRDMIGLDAVVIAASGNINANNPGFSIVQYPALLGSELPIVVVGGVHTSGIYAPYSKGLAAELTASAVGSILCAFPLGGTAEWEGTSFAAPAVAGLAAYLLSLDQYRDRLLVQGSVARNVRDLIKSLAYARRALQPATVWNGIDSRDIYCPVRRDAGSSGCPARNTTLPIVPPATPGSKPPPPGTTTGTSTTTVTSSSSISTGTSTTTMASSSSIATVTVVVESSSSVATDSSATSTFISTLTISLG